MEENDLMDGWMHNIWELNSREGKITDDETKDIIIIIKFYKGKDCRN